MSAKKAQTWHNGNAPEGATNTTRGLTRSLDRTKEGLAMKATSEPCKTPDCAKPAYCRGWCNNHYQQWKTTGTEPKMLDLPGRFADKFTVDSDTGCWNWRSLNATTGYGSFSVGTTRDDARTIPAHRAAWMLWVDPNLSADLHIDHLCRNRACVNPDHLEPVTPRENYLRGVSPVAINARKTHCAKGHEFNEENTCVHVRPGGGTVRECRVCRRIRQRKGVAA